MPTDHPAAPPRRTRRPDAEEGLRRSHELLQALGAAQSDFISDRDPGSLFDKLLGSLLDLTRSEYGFIGEVLYTDEGDPYLKTHAITNIAWNAETQALYDRYAATGMEFYNLNTLFGAVMTGGEPVIANDPANDPRRGGLPKDHPEMRAFCGIPFFSGEALVGMVGIANRPGGYDRELVDFLGPFLRTCSTIIAAYRNQVRARQAEAQLRESEARLRAIVSTAAEGIVTIDEKGTIEAVNAAAARLFAFEPEELIGRNVAQLMPSPHRERHKEYVEHYLRTGEARIIGLGREVEGRRRDGSTFPMYLSVSEVESGERRCFTGIMLDITQLKETEEALRRLNDELEQRVEERTDALRLTNRAYEQEIAERKLAEKRYRSLFERAPLMDVVTRSESGVPIIADCNKAFLETLGYRKKEVVGRPLADFYTPASGHKALEEGGYRHALEGRFDEAERDLLTKDGRVIATLLRTMPEKDGTGTTVGTRAMYLDITARKRAEEATKEVEEARRAREVAESESRLKDELVSVVGHELRTPLTSLRGFSQLLVERQLPAQKQRAYLEILHEETTRLTRLLNDFLDIQRLESERVEYDLAAVRLEEVVEEARKIFALQNEDARIVADISADLPAVRADRDRVVQVLSNLLSNALKFSPRETTVAVTARAGNGSVVVSIADRGSGIPPADLPRVFEKFYRSQAVGASAGGTGLGLAIVKKIVEGHRGEVSIESEVGQGTTVTFSLPVSEAD